MQSINKVILIGTVDTKPVIHYVDNGLVYTKFTLTTHDRYHDKNGELITITEWHNIVIWRKLAEDAEKQIKKGALVYLEGRIQSRSWEDKASNKHYITEIICNSFMVLNQSKTLDDIQKNDETKEKINQINFNIDEADELPF